MKILLLVGLVLLVAIPQAEAFLGVDVSQLFSVSAYQCMKQNGYGFVIPRGYYSYGAPDVNAVQNLKNARAAGMITDIYMFPCRGKSAVDQVDDMFNNVDPSLWGMVWVDVQTNPSSGCSWGGHDGASNCQFLTDIINRIKQRGKNPGIYASRYMWQTIFGSFGACQNVASQQLWYPHYDGAATFSDFVAFGGWSKPNIKQFQGTTSLCGASVDKNFYP